MRKSLGDMLYSEIERKKINQSDLCRGLCSTSALSRYLRNEVKIDRLLLNVLMQRIGKSADKFTTILSDDEYYYFLWRQKICYAQAMKDWTEVDELLKQERKKKWNCNLIIQEQFSLLMQGIVQKNLYNNKEESQRLIEEAILKTIPNFFEGNYNDLLLSVQEISAILIWQGNQENTMKSLGVLKFLVNYIDSHYKDEQEIEKIYPNVASACLKILFETEQYLECFSISERALKMMISSGYAMQLEKILSFNVTSAERLGMYERVAKRKTQLIAWKQLMEEINYSERVLDNDFYMLDIWQEIELLDELISLARIERGFTQEQLSEEICTPETLSRIEAGKRTPRRKTYNALMKKLSLREDYYYSEIETDDFSVLELKWRLERKIMNGNWEEAMCDLLDLERRLDMKSIFNQQYFQKEKYIIECRMNQIPASERVGNILQILRITMDKLNFSDEVNRNLFFEEKHYFFNSEISVLIQLSDALASQNRVEEAIHLLEGVLNYYGESRVMIEFHYRNAILILGRLSAFYGLLEKHEKSMQYSEQGIEMCKMSGNIKVLAGFINNKANALECEGDKSTSLKYYKLAFYASELMETNTAHVAKESYEKLLGSSKKWY